MSRQPVSNADFISLSEKAFLNVQFCYSLPTEDSINFKNCIVTTFNPKYKSKRVYKVVKFFNILSNEHLNSLEGDYAYISTDFDLDSAHSLVEKIKLVHSIE